MYPHRSFRWAWAIASALICFVVYAAKGQAPNPFLAANGVNIRNGDGTGDIVPLRGVNLGGWLVMEGWMCPMDSGSLSDNYTVVSTLDTRFGVATEQSLIRTYQYNWITTSDLQNIRNMGMNVVRVPVWWGNFETLAGAWRADAFDRLDWVVSNAWQRGIYTIIDMHGVVGGQTTSESTGQQNQNQYWGNSSYQSQTATIWSNIAVHYNGNPGVAAYDLMNEPYGSPSDTTLANIYNSLYQTIRAADPAHMIVMEGGYNGLADLPNPAGHGWSNVVYSAHEYEYASSTSVSGVESGIVNQVTAFNGRQFYKVPDFIGEFNCFSPGSSPVSVWEFAATNFDDNNMSWSPWAYKADHGSSEAQDSWGLYDPSGAFPTVPNIASDPATGSNSISNDWRQLSIVGYGINAMLQRSLGAPLAVADSYTATSGVAMAVSSGSGVLANDVDINHGQSGIQMTAVLVTGPANGQLTLNADGSFSYTSTAGFSGTDTFRYSVYDGYVNSANIATVTILVLPASTPAAPTGLTATGGDGVVSLIWNASLGAASYNVIRGTNSGGPYTLTNGVAAPSTNYTDSSVINGTPYYYVVSAVNSSGVSSNSAEATATPLSAYEQWQVQYFGSITNPAAAPDVDADGDGFSNEQEFLAGTDPTNAGLSFEITSIIVQSNGVNVVWMCGGGRTNVLQATSAMDGTYSNVSPNIILTGSGVTTTNYIDSGSLVVVSGAASDNASDPAYTGGNFNGANGGTGFGAWVVSPANNTGSAQWFIASSTTNGYNPPTGGIDSTGNKSWGSFANNGGMGTAIRVFSSGALVPGQVFSVDMDNGYVESGDSVGFNLQNSSGQTLLQINYIGANAASSYASIDGTGTHSLGVAYTDGGLHAHITVTSATTYSASLVANSGSMASFSGTLINPSGGQGISQIQLFDDNVAAGNSGANWMVFWNNFNVSSVTNTVNTGAPNTPTRYYRVLLVP